MVHPLIPFMNDECLLFPVVRTCVYVQPHFLDSCFCCPATHLEKILFCSVDIVLMVEKSTPRPFQSADIFQPFFPSSHRHFTCILASLIKSRRLSHAVNVISQNGLHQTGSVAIRAIEPMKRPRTLVAPLSSSTSATQIPSLAGSCLSSHGCSWMFMGSPWIV